MKLIKKASSVLLIFTLCFNLISTIGVFAAVKHDWDVSFDLIDSDVVTINLNLKKNLENSYGIQINAPKNAENPNDFQNVYSRGFARFTADGGMKIKDDGAWMQDDKSGGNTLDMTFPADGQWYNFKLRVNRVTQKVEWYFEDELVFTSNFTHKDGYYAANSFIIFGDSDYEPNGLEYELISAIGTNENEMSASVSEYDNEAKTITLDFSEPIASAGALSGIALKNTNIYGGDVNVPISIKSIDSSRVILSFEGYLANRSEYAIILPENLTGKFGNSITNNFLYFNTDYKADEIVIFESDYDKTTNIGMKDKNGTAVTNVYETTTDGHGKALKIISNDTDRSIWTNIPEISDKDLTLSFDLKPYKSDLGYIIEFSDSAFNTKPSVIGFTARGDIRLGTNTDSSAVGFEGGINPGWYGSNTNWGVAGMGRITKAYEADKWLHFDVVYHRDTDAIEYFINGVSKCEDKTITRLSAANVFGGIRFRQMEQYEKGTELFALDNVKCGYTLDTSAVMSVKYYNTEGREFGSFDTVEGIFDYARVYFSSSIADASIDDGDAYIAYNGEKVNCVTRYIEEEKCLEIRPAKIPLSDDEIVVNVSGIEDLGDNALEAVKASAKADKTESRFYVERIGITDSLGNAVTDTIGGNIFAGTQIINDTDKNRSVIITALGYKDGALEKHNYWQTSVNAHMPSDKTSFIRRYEVKEIGRYRVLAEIIADDIRGGNTVISVLKNGKKFYEQLVLDDENSVLDARVFAEPGDTIDVEIKAEKFMGYNYMEWTCNVSQYMGSIVADNIISSQGYSYSTESSTALSMISGNDRFSNGTEFYVYKYGVKHPMKWSTQKWVSTIDEDTSSISGSAIIPGNLTKPAFEMTVQKDGIIKLDGKFDVDGASDGVLIKVKQNGNIIWSSREGAEESMLWNKPYDDSYFNYNINVVASVKKGDKLEFSFDQWRKTNNDTVNPGNVFLKYIKGDVVSETTRWKLDKSIIIDTLEKTVRMNGNTSPVDVFVDGGKTYISKKDAERIFGATVESTLNIDGVDYAPIRSSIEKADRAVEWAADRLVIVNDGISVMFGWSELSEIKTALEGGVLFD